jgi:DNA-binding transcriptional LysR family regulator
MEMYQLENFVAVVEEHTFTRAAERVYRTQAAVSVAIRKLEDEIGVPLLSRESHRCALTDAGCVLLNYARRMIALRNEANGALAEFTSLATGQVSIAAHESAAQYLLPAPLAAFHSQYPKVKIITRLCGVDEIARLVTEWDVDLGFGIRQEHLAGLHSEIIHNDRLVVVAAAGHPLDNGTILQIADLSDASFITHHRHTSTVDHIEQLFGEKNFKFNVTAELWNFETIKRFVADGRELAIIPLSVARQDVMLGRLVMLSVPDLSIARSIEVVFRERSQLLPAAVELLGMLRKWKWNDGSPGKAPQLLTGVKSKRQPPPRATETPFRSRVTADYSDAENGTNLNRNTHGRPQ